MGEASDSVGPASKVVTAKALELLRLKVQETNKAVMVEMEKQDMKIAEQGGEIAELEVALAAAVAEAEAAALGREQSVKEAAAAGDDAAAQLTAAKEENRSGSLTMRGQTKMAFLCKETQRNKATAHPVTTKESMALCFLKGWKTERIYFGSAVPHFTLPRILDSH